MRDQYKRFKGSGERGATLVFVALFLALLLGILALAIDLGMLYVGRNEAQRAADAAALAGAYVFQQNGCTATNAAGAIDCSGDTTALNNATGQAESVGNANYVLGQAVNITSTGSANPPVCATGSSCPETSGGTVDITFPNSVTEPEVTVHVWVANVPTIFAKLFGSQSASVAAAATAEAYEGPQTVRYPKPFGVPNCDLNQGDSLPSNSGFCGSASAREFVDPSTQAVDTSVYGEPVLLHFQSSVSFSPVVQGTPVPSQFYLLQIGGPGASTLANNITMSNSQPVSCGESLPVETGNTSNGGVSHPIDSLIHSWRTGSQNPVDGPGNGQDTISNITPATVPLSYTLTGGSNNSVSPSQVYGGPSPSVQWVPIFNAVCSSGGSTCAGSGNLSTLSPGSGQGVQIVGFMQLFIVDAETQGASGHGATDPCNPTGQNWQGDSPVCTFVLQIAACSTSGSAGSASPVPLRLIQGPK